MHEIPLEVFDETLRDGEQQSGLCCSYEAKLELAKLIAATGVHQLDLMPAIDEAEAQLACTLVRHGLGDILTAATPIGKSYVDLAKACGLKRIVLFYATSDRLLVLRDPELRLDDALQGKTIDDDIPAAAVQRARDGMLQRVLETLHYAISKGMDLKVDFAAEDANRADPDFLLQCIRELAPFLGHFLLCDTVGALQPERASRWLTDLRKSAPHARLGVHFHNDMGLALENTLQAVMAGATMVSGTFGGIGERAGNVALDQVLNGLRLRYDRRVAGIDYEAIDAVTARLDALGLRPAAPYSRQAQRHTSGIHVQSLLQDRRSYTIFPEQEPEIWFGKMSGAANFQYLFEKRLGRPLAKDEYVRLSAVLKRRARTEQRCYSSEEVLHLLATGALDGQ